MRILIFGGSGMLGHKLVQSLACSNEVWTTIRGVFEPLERFEIFDSKRNVENTNVADPGSIRKAIELADPDVIINAVGIIKQLPISRNIVQTLSVNSVFPHRLAEFAETRGIRLITMSTDCVFSGLKGNYVETDKPDADDVYGKSKELGEVTGDNCLTIRTSIIGREIGTAHSLIEWFLGNRGGKVKGFENAIYSGFPTIIFAGIIKQIIEKHPELQGIHHISSEPINKFDLLCLVRDAYGLDIEIEPFADLRIDRSLNSERFRRETGFVPAPWNEMIQQMAIDPTPYGEWRK